MLHWGHQDPSEPEAVPSSPQALWTEGVASPRWGGVWWGGVGRRPQEGMGWGVSGTFSVTSFCSATSGARKKELEAPTGEKTPNPAELPFALGS